MSLRYVIFRDDPSTHKEIYLTRDPDGGFLPVEEPAQSNLQFESAGEGYDFAKLFPALQSWRVGLR